MTRSSACDGDRMHAVCFDGHFFLCFFVCLFIVCLFVCLFVCLCVCLCVCYLPLCIVGEKCPAGGGCPTLSLILYHKYANSRETVVNVSWRLCRPHSSRQDERLLFFYFILLSAHLSIDKPRGSWSLFLSPPSDF